ncbi:MAG TPA: S-layer homology domain-containing protein, partial [Acidimicrobiia bacterium]|nr:S-layer homology domain-containing protein [Acidimicrobiia bacterium]
MPTNVIAGRRSLVVLFAVFAMVIALLALPVAPANAAATAACPATTPSAGFTDIGGLSADAVDSINCIAFYNITKGTSATTYSPAANVARWQMALFLTRQATAHGVTLPSGADQGFTDLASLSAEATTAVNQLKQLAITTGTTATTYDPFGSVSRWQMALFITRLVTAAGITLPSGADQGFTDLAGLSAAAVTAVNQLKQLAISTGTSATTFDPFANVSRWQMALFLARTLQAGGVVPPGTGSIVTAVAAPDVSYADTAAGKVVKVTTKVTDKFSV